MKLYLPLVLMAAVSPAAASLRGIKRHVEEDSSPTASPVPTESDESLSPSVSPSIENSEDSNMPSISPSGLYESGAPSDLYESSETSGDNIQSDSALSIPFQDGLFLGIGVDAMTGRRKREILKVEGEPVREGKYDEKRHHMSTSTLKETEKTIKTIANAEGKAYGIAAGSSIDFVTSQSRGLTEISLIAGSTINSYLLSLRNDQIKGVLGTVLRELRGCKKISLQPDRRACYDTFVAKYGTHYVAEIGYGGSAYSRIKVVTKSRHDKEKIAFDLTASFKEAQLNATAKGEFKQEIENAKKEVGATVEGDFIMKGARVNGMGSQDLTKVSEALDRFGEQIEDGDRTAYPLYARLNEWESVPVIGKIMGDETLLGKIEPETMKDLTESYRMLDFVHETTRTMFNNDQWRKNIPSWSLDPQIEKADGLASRAMQTKLDIRSLKYTDLEGMNPESQEFKDKFMVAYKLKDEMDAMYEGYKLGATLFPHHWQCNEIDERVGFEIPASDMALGNGATTDDIMELTCSTGKLQNAKFALGAQYENGSVAMQMSLLLRGGHRQVFRGNPINADWASGQRSVVKYASGE
ncbi:MAG: hypothetical protein SGILL_008959, partial [Bacillariaceae sp.]